MTNFLNTQRVPTGYLWAVGLGLTIGSAWAWLNDEIIVIAAAAGATILSLIHAFELHIVRHSRGAWLRRLPLFAFILITALVWLAIIALTVQFMPQLFEALTTIDVPPQSKAQFGSNVLTGATIVLVLNLAVRISSLIGGKTLFRFLTGTYHHPIRENRIFLFLDMVGSTTIAEQLGSERYHAFLRDFIETIEAPVRDSGGEIYQYVGDEVVATWPLSSSHANSRAIDCHFAIERAFQDARKRFERKFGLVPGFASGMHCGEVIAGEIGDRRRQIVFVGDVVNTAARVEAEAKSLGKRLMITESLLDSVSLATSLASEGLGNIPLKGKAEPVALYEIRLSGT